MIDDKFIRLVADLIGLWIRKNELVIQTDGYASMDTEPQSIFRWNDVTYKLSRFNFVAPGASERMIISRIERIF